MLGSDDRSSVLGNSPTGPSNGRYPEIYKCFNQIIYFYYDIGFYLQRSNELESVSSLPHQHHGSLMLKSEQAG